MKFGKIGVAVISLVPFNVYGECTPTPDCDAIGYTETSCEGAFIKCPFDTSKLFCVPCDSSFKYDCSGNNITSGLGSTCGGKYASCECVYGATFVNGSCVCDTSCKVGNIYYSDGSCSSCLDSTKIVAGVVVKDNELVMSNEKVFMSWSAYLHTDVVGINNITEPETAYTDYAGVENTSAIIATYSDNTIENNAAMYCREFAPEGFESSLGQWYLPAGGEAHDCLYDNYDLLKPTYVNLMGWSSFVVLFWTSSEYGTNLAWVMYTGDGVLSTRGKATPDPWATCFLKI